MALPALLIRKSSASIDPQLQPGARGARKQVVTKLYESKERLAGEVFWNSPVEDEKCPVMVADNLEVATFNEVTGQDRHSHGKAREIYIVLDGTMYMEVAGETYGLGAGDMIIINPGMAHEVLRQGSFLCRVITPDCGGPADKFPA